MKRAALLWGSVAGMLWAAATWPKFSRTSYRMVQSLKRQDVLPNTVIDVGANVGQFAVTSAKLFPVCVVHAFEPIPECAEELRRNCRQLNVKVYEMAVGDVDGTISININSHRHSSSILPLGIRHRQAFPFAKEQSAVRVPIARLDGVLGGVQLIGPVLLKLDVQGYEPWVLRGASGLFDRIDYVLLEASFRPMYDGELTFTQILPLMESLDFEFLRPVDLLRDPSTGEILQMDMLFESRRRKHLS